MYCVNCGKELPENARFCLYCGTKVNSIVEAKPQVSNEEVLTNYFVNTIPFIYNDLKECIDYPYIYGYINGKVCLLDTKDASMVVPCQYDKIVPYFYTESKQFAYSEVQRNGKWGFYQDGNEITQCIYDSIKAHMCNNRIYIVQLGDKYGIINSATWEKTECIYDYIELKDGVIYTRIDIVAGATPEGLYYDSRYGLLDYTCEELLSCQYTGIENIDNTNGQAFRIFKNGKQGVFNAKNKKCTECVYDDIEIINNFLNITCNGKQGILKFEFTEILPCVYDSITLLGNQFFCIEQNNKYGIYAYSSASDRKIIIPCIYDSITMSNNNFFIVERNNKYGVCDYWGKECEPCVHNKIQYVKDIETKTDDRFIEIKLDENTIIKELVTDKMISVNNFETLLLDYAKLLDSLNILHY